LLIHRRSPLTYTVPGVLAWHLLIIASGRL